jgi:GTP pyrophosphokinase
MLSSSAAADLAPFEGELRETFGEALADLPSRALQLARGASQAAGRTDAIERAVAVARLLLVQGGDPETIAAALISQAIPDAELDIDGIQAALGPELALLLKGLARAGRIEALNAPSADLEQLRKMLLAIAEDVRVVLIKLAERVVYLRGITKADEAVRRAAGRQTLELFSPLANRLGVSEVKWELEDFAFRYTEPELYKKIAQLLDEKRNDREAYIQRVVGKLREELAAMGIDPVIQGRPKHIFSIARKMRGKDVSFERLYDIRAVRVIVANVRECYTVLGVVHDLWQPIDGEFDDYIARPKSNGYRSLHTAVVGPEGRTLEVQIRTQEMHEQSELGVAAHWRYKEGPRSDRKFDAKIAWLRQVLAWKNEVLAGDGAVDARKRGLFEDTIYVLTPQGRVVDLPAGSTPIDFAYHVHTDLGHRCRGAKVDGQMVPLDYKLQNAQRVDIMAAKQGGPSRDWLSPQHGTSRARGRSPRCASGSGTRTSRRTRPTGAPRSTRSCSGWARRVPRTTRSRRRSATRSSRISSRRWARRGELAPDRDRRARRGARAGRGARAHRAGRAFGAHVLGRPGAGREQHRDDGRQVLQAGAPDPIIGFITRARGVMVHRRTA